MALPLFTQSSAVDALQSQIGDTIQRIIASGTFVLGPELEAFEREFAEYLDVEHVVGVGNGTDAITLALLALGVGPGDEVVVPAFTFWASAEAIVPTVRDPSSATSTLTPTARVKRPSGRHSHREQRPSSPSISSAMPSRSTRSGSWEYQSSKMQHRLLVRPIELGRPDHSAMSQPSASTLRRTSDALAMAVP